MKRVFSAPGRVELGGNHTDHQGGHALAAAVKLLMTAEAEPNEDGLISVVSEGYAEATILLDDLGPKNHEKNRPAALIRGVAEYLAGGGYKIGGFKARVMSDIPAGRGLSSSAAFEILIGRIISALFNGALIPELELARAGRYAETEHFGKPCGLLDQCACVTGGVVAVDFSGGTPSIKRINADFGGLGYALFIIDTGGTHADFTRDYAEIADDMKAVARELGKGLLSQVGEAEFLALLPELRKKSALGDRALLRALHFFEEDARARALAAALERGDMTEYLGLMDESARSSAELLQNSFAPSTPQNQGISLALALGRRFHGKRGATRVHGGGFAGSVQALVPSDMADGYKAEMERVFGPGSCVRAEIYGEAP